MYFHIQTSANTDLSGRMLLSAELLLPVGPPPQAVLDQHTSWQCMLALLAVTLVLRLVGLDVAGALLSGLMLCFGIIMTRDGMQEMAKYALVYAVLCGLNFFFDILPLITELGGRVNRSTQPGPTATDKHGTRQTSYTLTTRTTPFFDREQGLVYNVQSLAMILSPLSMALGVYLSISAHNEIQRYIPFITDDDADELGRAFLPPTGSGVRGIMGPRSRGAGSNQPRPGGRESLEHFTGTGHKLGD